MWFRPVSSCRRGDVRRSAAGLVSVLLMAALAATSLAAGPAAADSVSLRDPKGDAYIGDEYGDVTKLVLRHTRKRVVLAVTLNPKTGWPDEFMAKLDTMPKEAGFEFRVAFYRVFYGLVLADDRWRDVKCRGARHRSKYGPGGKHTGGRLVISVPPRLPGVAEEGARQHAHAAGVRHGRPRWRQEEAPLDAVGRARLSPPPAVRT